jgi:titin
MPTISKAFMTDESRALPSQMSRLLSALRIISVLVAFAAGPGDAATLVVTTTNASGPGSLQQAILDANATNGLDTIIFQIPGTGVHTISPTNALPSISDPVVIDGTTQPDYSGAPLIQISGANAGATSDGLRLTAGSSTILGLAINGFGGAGIHVQLPGGTNFIQGNYIGTDPTGTLSRGNGSAAQSGGVWIDGSSGNWIGGPYPTNRNLVSGNTGPGVYLLNCAGNTVQGNLIGTSASGAAALGNSNNGISLYNAGGNQVGGTAAVARNLISGNGGSGVYLSGSGATGNLVQGNYIGTDTNGSLALPNAGDGVTVNGAPANTIGAANLLSGNSQSGLSLNGAGAGSNLVQGNYIGTDASGKHALGNQYSGVTVFGGNSNLVGGTTAAARNVVSANKLSGIYITTNSAGNLVQGNYIGVDATGTNALGNAANGISIDSANSNTVGGATPGATNIISGNTNYGIEIYNTGATGNSIQGNYIGTAVTGQFALANQLSGVHIQSSGNTIGGILTGAGNLISGNGQDGIFLDGASAANNLVQGNFIGTVASGTSGLGNGRGGVGISGAPGNTIGGTASSAGNVISANANAAGQSGIWLFTSGAAGNLIQGNKIGTDVTGTQPLGNTYEGIYLDSAPSNTIGGIVAGAGNLISANHTRGILLTNAAWNVIQGNLIGTARDGLSDLGNQWYAFECTNASNNMIGGTNPAAGNCLAWSQLNGGYGCPGARIRGGSTNDAILGNAIFSNLGLGIDLGTYGVNANISCDATAGDNMAQNYPVLTEAVSGRGIGISGTLNSRPNAKFLLQFFANPVCGSSSFPNNGQGQLYLGQMSVVTSNNCNTSFVAALPGSVPAGYVITATATDSANNTSEFSACVTAGLVPGLSVSPSTNHQVTLAWTNAPTGFVLEQSTNLSPPIQWTAVTNMPVLTNGQFVLSLPAGTGSRFYVLRFE